jgi:hypothetical protein
MKALAALFVTLFAASALAQDKSFVIGEIEFFGYSHLDLDRIKVALPLHEGDLIAIQDFPATKEKIGQSVRREIGREATDVKFVCCDDRGNLMIFVGLPGKSIQSLQYNPKPKGSAKLPRSILELYDRAEDLNLEAVQKQPGEDRSKGYGLSEYAPMRETQLAIRQLAIHNDLLIRRLYTRRVPQLLEDERKLIGGFGSLNQPSHHGGLPRLVISPGRGSVRHSKRADRLICRPASRRSHRTVPARASRAAWCL